MRSFRLLRVQERQDITLTNRIGYALVGEAGTSGAFIDSIDEVLATTFSKSGAAEMKSRVRVRFFSRKVSMNRRSAHRR